MATKQLLFCVQPSWAASTQRVCPTAEKHLVSVHLTAVYAPHRHLVFVHCSTAALVLSAPQRSSTKPEGLWEGILADTEGHFMCRVDSPRAAMIFKCMHGNNAGSEGGLFDILHVLVAKPCNYNSRALLCAPSHNIRIQSFCTSCYHSGALWRRLVGAYSSAGNATINNQGSLVAGALCLLIQAIMAWCS